MQYVICYCRIASVRGKCAAKAHSALQELRSDRKVSAPCRGLTQTARSHLEPDQAKLQSAGMLSSVTMC